MITSQHIDNCQLCPLCKGRSKVVHSVLPERAKMLIIGEAPGADEDQQGVPFVGQAGRLLNEALEQAGLARDRVAIGNMCCCRPPGNRKPSKEEIKTCTPFLEKEIDLLKPNIILLLGNTPVSYFLPNLGTITKIRGRRFESQRFNCTMFATWHPAATLYDATKKPQFFNDIKTAVNLMDSGVSIQQSLPRNYKTVENKKQFDWLIDKLNSQPEWAFDCETTGTDFLTDTIFLMTFSWEERTAVLLDLRNDFCAHNLDYVWDSIKSVMKNDKHKIMQNGSFDIKMLMKAGVKVRGFFADTMLMHFCVSGDTRVNCLRNLEVFPKGIPIKSLVGQENLYVWSYDFTKERITPKRVFNIRKTRENAELWELKYYWYSNHKKCEGVIKATPEHKIMLRSGNYKCIKDLLPGDRLMPVGECLNPSCYPSIYTCNKKFGYKLQHQYIYKEIFGEYDSRKFHVHHRDLNRYNVELSNLELLDKNVHRRLHTVDNPKWYHNLKNSHLARYNKLSEKEKYLMRLNTKKANEARWGVKSIYSWHNKGLLLELYVNQSMSCLEIANLLGTQSRVISKFLKKFSIGQRTLSQQQKIRRKKESIECNHTVIYSKPVDKREDVYCLDVPGTHNFGAEGIIIHNCLEENLAHNLGAIAWEYTDIGGYETELEQYVNQLKVDKRKQRDEKKKELKARIKAIQDSLQEDVDSEQSDEISEEDVTEDDSNLDEALDLLARISKKEKIQVSYSDIPNDILFEYACSDADVTYRAYKAMMPLIKRDDLEFTLLDIVMPAQIMLIMTEFYGVKVDKSYLIGLQQKYEMEISNLKRALQSDPSVVGFINHLNSQKRAEYLIKYSEDEKLRRRYLRFEEYFTSISDKKKYTVFNPKSSVQLGKFLFKYLSLPVIEYTKGKDKKPTETPSTSAAVLEQLSSRNEACNIISKTRKLMQLKSTFIDGMLGHIDSNEKIHTQYFLNGTKTGRPSSRYPNLNNIPRKATASDIKNTFIAEDGCYLIEFDGKAMEFRVWASMSKDQRMIRDIELGLDIHKVMGGVAYFNRDLPKHGDISSEKFAELTKDVTKEQRQDAKTEVVFGPIYGRTASAISKSLGMPTKEAERVLNNIKNRYRVGFAYLESLKLSCRRDGYVCCMFGRRRHIPELRIRQDFGLERQASNSVIQGSASDLTLMAGVRILSRIWKSKWPIKLVLTVYDSLVFNVPKNLLKDFIPIAFEEFERPLEQLNVKIEAEAKVGKRWGDMVEVTLKQDLDEQLKRVYEQFEKEI